MLSPQFLDQIKQYLSASGGPSMNSGLGAIISNQGAAAPMPASNALTSGIQSGINSVVGHTASANPSAPAKPAVAEWMPIPVTPNRPPAGYRPGYDPEWDYGIGNPQTATAIRAYNDSLNNLAAPQGMGSNRMDMYRRMIMGMVPGGMQREMLGRVFDKQIAQKPTSMGSGGTVSTGNKVADARIAAGDQRVIRNQEAAATYAAMDNARDGTPIPAHLQQRLDARSSSAPSGRSMEDGMGQKKQGLFGGIGNLMSGQVAGFKNWGDMVDGGGRYGTRDNPGPRQGGLRAMAGDVNRGGLGALLRDSFDGGGYGASGDKFVGGPRSWVANLLNIKPIAFDQRFLGTEANDYGTQATEGTSPRPMPRPRGMAEGGIATLDIPMAAQGGNEKDLISQAVSAIKGEVADPRAVLAAFVSQYGEDALRNLVDKVESGDLDATAQASQGQLRGPGDGMSDMIPASVDGESDVLLSDGEYVVPADVVSGLGNGSSDAGSKHLDEMMARVREQRTGSREQAKQINPKQAMPA